MELKQCDQVVGALEVKLGGPQFVLVAEFLKKSFRYNLQEPALGIFTPSCQSTIKAYHAYKPE